MSDIQKPIRHNRFCVMIAVCCVVAGCAQQRIRNEADNRLSSGDFESAISELKEGVKLYPESALLRAGLASANAESIARLIAESARSRASNQFDNAQKALDRGLNIEPKNERLLSLKAELLVERKLLSKIKDAESLQAEGKPQQALRVVEAALRDLPRQPTLIALQRSLEIDLRAASGESGKRNLIETRPLSLDFRNASLSTVLEAITRASNVNFILDRDIKQDARVTIFLRSAKAEDALDLVLSAQQLARKTIDPQTVLIYPNSPEKQREHQEQVIRVFHLSNTEAKTAAAMLRSLLRIKEPFVDEKANFVAIRESPEIVALAERLIGLQDVGDAEVMLEVEILEIKTSKLTELGISFPNSVALAPLTSGGLPLTVGNLRNLNSDRIGVSISGLIANLRREVGDFNILANPRIRSKNREKAKVLIGDRVPVITASTSASGFLSENVTYLDVGLKLEVEPVVSPDDEITLKLALEVSSLAREVRTSGGSLAYQIGTRNTNSTLRLRDGETQILAGLISNDDRTSSSRIPGLGDLPILGRLFSSQKEDVQRTELILAITPRILRNAPRPDIAQAELWIGTEIATRLQARPNFSSINNSNTKSDPTFVKPAAAQVLSPNAEVAPILNKAASNSDLPHIGPPRLTWLAPDKVKVGEVFSASLFIESADALRGLPIEISFPSEVLEVVEVSEGDFFKQNNGQTNFTHAINATTGRIGISLLRGDIQGAIGKGSLVKLHFKAKNASPIELSLTSAKLIGLTGALSATDMPTARISTGR